MTPDDMIEFILEDEELSKNLLIRAVNKGKIEIIEKVVNSLPSFDEKKRDDIIWTVLHVIHISELTPEVFRMLIKNGPSTYYIADNRIRCYTPYCIYRMIRHFADFNMFDYFVARKRNDLLRKLFEKYDIDPLEFGENNDHNDDWCSAPNLFTTLVGCNYEGAKLLIEHGADINQLCVPIKRDWNDDIPDIRKNEPNYPLCYQVLRHCSEESRDALAEFMLDFGADLSDSEKLRLCCKDESIIEKIEDFYKEPKKRAKPDQN